MKEGSATNTLVGYALYSVSVLRMWSPNMRDNCQDKTYTVTLGAPKIVATPVTVPAALVSVRWSRPCEPLTEKSVW